MLGLYPKVNDINKLINLSCPQSKIRTEKKIWTYFIEHIYISGTSGLCFRSTFCNQLRFKTHIPFTNIIVHWLVLQATLQSPLIYKLPEEKYKSYVFICHVILDCPVALPHYQESAFKSLFSLPQISQPS